jgi:cell wall-associated NlpC family hydrolase
VTSTACRGRRTGVASSPGSRARRRSGLALAAYATIGVRLPHASALQARMGVAVPDDPASVRPGDLLFYFSPSDGVLGRVAIAISNVEEIHAPRTVRSSRSRPPICTLQAIRRFVASANSHEVGT